MDTHPALEYAIVNAYENLSDEWQIIIYHGNKNQLQVKEITSRIDPLRIRTVHLPLYDMNPKRYNTFMKSTMFYEQVPTEYFLMLQVDSMIIPKYKHMIYEYISKSYDYVGPPMTSTMVKSGLSLRKKSVMLDIIEAASPFDIQDEQVFFSSCASLPIKKPNMEESSHFCIETVLTDQAFSCHRPWDFISQKILFDMYPEIKPLYELCKREAL